MSCKVRSWVDVNYDDVESSFLDYDSGTENLEPGMTQQHFEEEVNINKIIEKYGGVPIYSDVSAMYGDFSKIPSFLEYQNTLLRAEVAFNSLPNEIRKNFDTIGEFLKFVDDPLNADLVNSWSNPAKPAGGSEVPPAPGQLGA